MFNFAKKIAEPLKKSKKSKIFYQWSALDKIRDKKTISLHVMHTYMSIMKSSNLHDVKKPLNIMIYNCLMKLTLLASIFNWDKQENYYKWLSEKSCRKWERRGNEDCRPR